MNTCPGTRIASKAMFTLGARARLSLGTNVNTPFFRLENPPQNSGKMSVPEYKVETFYSGTKVGVYILGTQCLNTAPFSRCPNASARAPSVNMVKVSAPFLFVDWGLQQVFVLVASEEPAIAVRFHQLENVVLPTETAELRSRLLVTHNYHLIAGFT